MRDLPLNKQQRKEGCLILTILGIIVLIGLMMIYYEVNCK
jgi:hypothetical protein